MYTVFAQYLSLPPQPPCPVPTVPTHRRCRTRQPPVPVPALRWCHSHPTGSAPDAVPTHRAPSALHHCVWHHQCNVHPLELCKPAAGTPPTRCRRDAQQPLRPSTVLMRHLAPAAGAAAPQLAPCRPAAGAGPTSYVHPAPPNRGRHCTPAGGARSHAAGAAPTHCCRRTYPPPHPSTVYTLRCAHATADAPICRRFHASVAGSLAAGAAPTSIRTSPPCPMCATPPRSTRCPKGRWHRPRRPLAPRSANKPTDRLATAACAASPPNQSTHPSHAQP